MLFPVFHIGHHKTATTWLQNGLFAQHAELNLLAKPSCPWDSPLLQSLIGESERTFSAGKSSEILQGLLCEDGRVPILSAERLSGHPLSGGFDSLMIARRIHAISPTSKIIIGVRHQATMLTSLYIQMLKEGFTGSYDQFLNSISWKRPFFRLDYLEYHYIVDYYQQLFGKHNVLITVYEDLVDDQEAYLKKICDFIGVSLFERNNINKPVNTTGDVNVAALIKRNVDTASEFNINPAIKFLSKAAQETFQEEMNIPDYFLRAIPAEKFGWQRFADSNRKLFALINRDNRYESLDRECSK